ncbi:hypothetical protein AVEN_256985-1 [Araneus ventricosus]|uniref:Uncharacterized protein n=1 Tax=Araneus ventricosus TaxID=182803 RepID=A0A4Y2TKD5_ARAVE|nr:hypothetical protein AVEN_256985-1 [Araneus ventricosus]
MILCGGRHWKVWNGDWFCRFGHQGSFGVRIRSLQRSERDPNVNCSPLLILRKPIAFRSLPKRIVWRLSFVVFFLSTYEAFHHYNNVLKAFQDRVMDDLQASSD